MAELIAIRTFMKLRVLEAIPETGSISLAELAGKTGVQPSLLGELPSFLSVYWDSDVLSQKQNE